MADAIADGIIQARPFASPSELAHIRDGNGEPLFGNPQLHAPNDNLQWSDPAAEELFARMYQSSGVRSRNFRVWLVGQAIGPDGKVTAVERRAVTLFVDPGERSHSGSIQTDEQQVRVLHVRDF